jgi:hypothetical protein
MYIAEHGDIHLPEERSIVAKFRVITRLRLLIYRRELPLFFEKEREREAANAVEESGDAR